MDITAFLVLSLACVRLAKLLADETGPFEILEKLRYRLGVRYNEYSQRYGKNELSKAIVCKLCNSVWIGLVLSVAYLANPTLTLWVCLPLALSAVVVLFSNTIGD